MTGLSVLNSREAHCEDYNEKLTTINKKNGETTLSKA